jgi:2-polyprenyl-3-methyl-5-hydroxy-6-metoxy-1,4-benzoquinol methylase
MTVAKEDFSSAAFGVEPGYPTYRLRQARYHALAEDVARLAAEARAAGKPKLKLLDVGVNDGVSRRYIEVHEASEHIEWHGLDIYPEGREYVYKHQEWTLHECNLEGGPMPFATGEFDLVICEQVLEHLHGCEAAAAELVRVLKPGGMLAVGVPIFPPGLHLVRKHLVPLTDKLFGVTKKRGHVQAFSLSSFKQVLKQSGDLDIQTARGFRIISGGPLRKLEYQRWWWQFNRWLGSLLPSLCVETQILAVKQGEPETAAEENSAVILKFEPKARQTPAAAPAARPRSKAA